MREETTKPSTKVMPLTARPSIVCGTASPAPPSNDRVVFCSNGTCSALASSSPSLACSRSVYLSLRRRAWYAEQHHRYPQAYHYAHFRQSKMVDVSKDNTSVHAL
eukprot:3541195-Rhodomonas_salina.1